jgi:hypothetical protein
MGPAVVPGPYSVTLTVDGREVGSRNFEVKVDPRLKGVTQADLQARFDLVLQIRDRTSEANEAVIRIREIKAEIDDRLEASGDEGLAAMGNEVKAALSAVEGEIYQVRNRSNQDPLNFPIKLNNKLAALMGGVEGSENRPTDQSYAVFEYLSGLLQAQLDQMEAVLSAELPALNARMEELGLEPIKSGG